jgi:hypothetical protein
LIYFQKIHDYNNDQDRTYTQYSTKIIIIEDHEYLQIEGTTPEWLLHFDPVGFFIWFYERPVWRELAKYWQP